MIAGLAACATSAEAAPEIAGLLNHDVILPVICG
jgi:hypothetical protein